MGAFMKAMLSMILLVCGGSMVGMNQPDVVDYGQELTDAVTQHKKAYKKLVVALESVFVDPSIHMHFIGERNDVSKKMVDDALNIPGIIVKDSENNDSVYLSVLTGSVKEESSIVSVNLVDLNEEFEDTYKAFIGKIAAVNQELSKASYFQNWALRSAVADAISTLEQIKKINSVRLMTLASKIAAVQGVTNTAGQALLVAELRDDARAVEDTADRRIKELRISAPFLRSIAYKTGMFAANHKWWMIGGGVAVAGIITAVLMRKSIGSAFSKFSPFVWNKGKTVTPKFLSTPVPSAKI